MRGEVVIRCMTVAALAVDPTVESVRARCVQCGAEIWSDSAVRRQVEAMHPDQAVLLVCLECGKAMAAANETDRRIQIVPAHVESLRADGYGDAQIAMLIACVILAPPTEDMMDPDEVMEAVAREPDSEFADEFRRAFIEALHAVSLAGRSN